MRSDHSIPAYAPPLAPMALAKPGYGGRQQSRSPAKNGTNGTTQTRFSFSQPLTHVDYAPTFSQCGCNPSTTTNDGHVPGASSPASTSSSRLISNKPFEALNYCGEAIQSVEWGESYDYGKHESRPDITVNHKSYSKALSILSEIPDKISSTVKVGTHDEELRTLVEDLERSRSHPATKAIRVGLLGSAGVGKSSALKAILGDEYLATSGSSGQACTQTVTEYLALPKHEPSCTAHIHFKSTQVIADEIKGHVLSYLRPDDSDKSTVDTEDLEADRKIREEQKHTAETFMLSLFAELEGFQDAAALTETMDNYSHSDCKSLIDELCAHAADLMSNELVTANGGHQRSYCVINESSTARLCAAVKRYSDIQPSGFVSYWPLVQLVQIYVVSPLLQQGLVLADCPGLGDENISRRDATNKYLRQCDAVIIPSTIDRIVDCAYVKDYIELWQRTGGSGRVLLMPTKVDLIEEDPGNGKVSMKDVSALRECQAAVEEATRHVRSFDRRQTRSTEYAEATAAKADAIAMQQKTRIDVRNRSVVELLRNEIKRLGLDDQQFSFIPIASTVHMEYVKGGCWDKLPILPVDKDGVSSVRAELSKWATEDSSGALENHLKRTVPHMLSKLDVVLEKSIYDRMSGLRDLVKKHGSNHSPIQFYKSTVEHFEQAFKKFMDLQFSKEGNAWAVGLDAALKTISDEWSPQPKTFRAFVMNFGIHAPTIRRQKQPLQDWNFDIASGPRELALQALEEFVRLVEGTVAAVQAAMNIDLDNLQAEMSGSEHIQSINMDSFWEEFRYLRLDFADRVKEIFDEIIRDFRGIILKETAQDTRSHFYQAMRELWPDLYMHHKIVHKEKGVMGRRVEYLRANIARESEDSPFTKLGEAITLDLKLSLRGLREKLHEILKLPYTSLHTMLERRFSDNTAEQTMSSAERANLRTLLRPKIAEARADLKLAIAELDNVQLWERLSKLEVKHERKAEELKRKAEDAKFRETAKRTRLSNGLALPRGARGDHDKTI